MPGFFILLALISLALGASAQEVSPAPSDPARVVAEAELAFARMAAENNVRDAFVTFLADGAVTFDPGPINGRKQWEARSANESQLRWAPAFAAISKDGDLGYTTGPSTFKASPTAAKPNSYGQFFSIWKKDTKGAWKVALDIGFETPPLTTEWPPLRLASWEHPAESLPQKEALASMQKAENQLGKGSRQDASAALLAVAADGIQVFRENVFPAFGKEVASVMLSADRGRIVKSTQDGQGMSASGDLGYVYGTFRVERLAGAEAGSFVRVWRREPDGRWRVVADGRTKHRPKASPPPAAAP